MNRKVDCWIDVEAFGITHRGMSHLEQRQWQDALPELQKAERLRGGDFLEDSYAEWSDDFRLKTRAKYIEILHALGKYFFDKGKFEVSIDYWKRLLGADDCHEEAYQGLMLSYAAMDNPNEAIKLYPSASSTEKRAGSLSPHKMMELYLSLMRGKESDTRAVRGRNSSFGNGISGRREKRIGHRSPPPPNSELRLPRSSTGGYPEPPS